MNICIFCSATDADATYSQPAAELASKLAQAGHHLVWGGSNAGLMSVMADTFRKHGGKLYGYGLEAYKHNLHQSADEMIIAKDLGVRKAAMLARADVLIALPGGLGTLDEITEVIELRKQKHHEKPIVILNSAGYYDGLKQLLTRMSAEGFLAYPYEKLVLFVDTPQAALAALKK